MVFKGKWVEKEIFFEKTKHVLYHLDSLNLLNYHELINFITLAACVWAFGCVWKNLKYFACI